VFVAEIQSFTTTVHSLVEVLDAQAKRIEDQKLKVGDTAMTTTMSQCCIHYPCRS
jgi:hypothetical protein